MAEPTRRRHRRPRRARDSALRVPDPRARPRADRRTCPTTTPCAATARRRSSCSTASGTRRRRPRTRSPSRATGIGWEEIPSSAPASRPAPPRRAVSRPGRRVLVTGGSRGIGRAIALRLAREGATRVAIGYFRSDAAAEETADELRGARRRAGARARQRHLVPRRGAGRRARAARRARPQRRDRRDPPGARDRGQALGLDAERERARAARADARRRAVDAAGLVDRRDLEPRLGPRARELLARRHLEGGARGARPLPRGRARAAGDPRQRRLRRRRRDRRARPLPEPGGDARVGRRRTRPAGSSRRTTSPAPSRSSARPTPR